MILCAIAAIEGGAEEYKIGWRSVRRADLTALYAERRALRHELAAEAAYFPGSQFCYVARRPFRYWAWTYRQGGVVQGLPPQIATMLLRRGVIEPFVEAR
jgi:hypothetical protein